MRHSFVKRIHFYALSALYLVLSSNTVYASGVIPTVELASTGSYQNYPVVTGTSPNISNDGRYIVFNAGYDTLAISPGVSIKDTLTGEFEHLNIDLNGNPASQGVSSASVSNDGRFVVFGSRNSNLVPNDTNNLDDIFVRDRDHNTTQRVNISSSGVQANGVSGGATISGNGRYVVFTSRASNLVNNDTNGTQDVFRHDLHTGSTIRVSVNSEEEQTYCSGLHCNDPYSISVLGGISDDGRYIVFQSYGVNLSPLYRNVIGAPGNVYVRDVDEGTTLMANISYQGQQNIQGATPLDISNDGRYVLFKCGPSAQPCNLTPGSDTGGQLYVRDMSENTIVKVSVSNNGTESNSVTYISPRFVNSGQAVMFASPATSLTSNDTNGRADVFLHSLTNSSTSLVPMPDSLTSIGIGQINFSESGRYVTLSTSDSLTVDDVDAKQDTFLVDTVATPDTPTNLQGPDFTNTYPTLTWDLNTNADAYNVYRDSELLTTVTQSTYTDISVNEGSHTYTVTALNESAESGESNIVTVVVDYTNPIISLGLNPVANSNEWYSTDVSITFTCTDELSGVASCSEPVTLTDESASQTATGTATDNAGNESSVTTESINIDKTAPNFGTPLWSDDTIRTDGSATLTIPVSDSLSGVDSGEYFIGTDPGVGNGTALTFDGNGLAAEFSNLGAGVYTISYRAVDIAGNWTDVQTTTLMVRSLAPSGLGAPTPTNTDPALNWTAVQAADEYHVYRNGSLIDTTTNTTYSDVTAQEGSIDYHVTAVANGVESDPSNTTTVVVDRMTPTVIYTQAPAANENGWYNTDVTVTFTCNDAQTGIASCTSPITLSNEGSGQTATGNATDNAGNESSVTTGSINIDKTAPTVNSPSMTGGLGSLYVLTTNTTITATANDNLSGVFRAEYYFDTDPGVGNGTAMTVNGTTVSANSSLSGLFGQHTLYVRVQDAAGNWSNLASYTFTRIGL